MHNLPSLSPPVKRLTVAERDKLRRRARAAGLTHKRIARRARVRRATVTLWFGGDLESQKVRRIVELMIPEAETALTTRRAGNGRAGSEAEMTPEVRAKLRAKLRSAATTAWVRPEVRAKRRAAATAKPQA